MSSILALMHSEQDWLGQAGLGPVILLWWQKSQDYPKTEPGSLGTLFQTCTAPKAGSFWILETGAPHSSAPARAL